MAVEECVSDTKKRGQQNFTLTWHKDLRVHGRTMCLDVSDPNDKADVVLYPCHGMKGNQYWKYDMVSKNCFIVEKIIINISWKIESRHILRLWSTSY